jgi:hypothetical protein
LETGRCVHHLGGHTGYDRGTIDAFYTPDGRRLFTVESNLPAAGPTGVPGRAAGKPQIHIWDTADGRELLTLDQGEAPGFGTVRAQFDDGKLILQSIAGSRTFDGRPEKK